MRTLILSSLTGLLTVALCQTSEPTSAKTSATASPGSSGTTSKGPYATALVQSDLQQYIDANPPSIQDSLLTVVGSSTSYIGPASDLTSEDVTETVQSRPTVIRKTYDVSVATVTAAEDGMVEGDLSIAVGSDLLAMWKEAASSACGLPKRHRFGRRDAVSCDLQAYLRDIASRAGPDAVVPNSIGSMVVDDVAVAAAVDALVAGGTITTANVGYFTLAAMMLTAGITEVGIEMSHFIRIPASRVGTLTATPTVKTTEGVGATSSDKSSAESTTGSKSSSACPSGTDIPSKSPFCIDQLNCKGDDKKLCTEGDHKGCACQDTLVPIADVVNVADLDGLYEFWSSFSSFSAAGITSVEGMTTGTDDTSTATSASSNSASGSKTSSAPAESPTCDKNDVKLPVEDVKRGVEVWCKGRDLSVGGTGIVNSDQVDNAKWDGKLLIIENFHLEIKSSEVCTEQDCIDTLQQAVSDCNVDKTSFSGHASLKPNTCGSTFDITIAVPYKNDDPKICSGNTINGREECSKGVECSGSSASCNDPDGSHPYPYCSC